MKWSDGAPFTADDFVFWFEEVYSNKEIVPVPLSVMTINGKPISIKKVDASTVQIVAPEPYFALPTVLASVWGIGHHARFGRDALGGFAPAHYLKQFHPKFASKDDLAKRLADLKFENWVLLFKNRNDACRNPDLPVVTPWKTVSPINTPTWILERNPYSVWVDTDGNQLPYIDRIRMTLGESLELINLRAIAGEYDSQARHIDISKLPVLVENQQKGNYRVHLDPSDQGADVGALLQPELRQGRGDRQVAQHAQLPHRALPRHRPPADQRDLRARPRPDRLGGAGRPHPVLPGPGVQDPAHGARREEGQRDARRAGPHQEGQRRAIACALDGSGRLRLALTTYLGFLPFTRVAEMIVEQWRAIGIRGEVQEMERGLATARMRANEHQIYFETQWGADNIYGHIPLIFPAEAQSPLGPLYGVWYSSAGAKGKQPPARMAS